MTQHRPGRAIVILVVEDQPLLRLMAVDMVEEAGFVALEAADSLQAVAILEARADVGLVFSDIDMPGGPDGMALAATIRCRWPPIAIILTSGFIPAAAVRLPAGGVFFPKPYLSEAVVDTMHRLAA